MKDFALTTHMLAPLGGAFYPTGHALLMFGNPEQAKQAAAQIQKRGAAPSHAIQYISPETLLSQISPTVSDADNPLPSAGSDAATVRAFTALAQKGHAALLVETPSNAARDAVMAALGELKPSMAQRYRMLVIEDL